MKKDAVNIYDDLPMVSWEEVPILDQIGKLCVAFMYNRTVCYEKS